MRLIVTNNSYGDQAARRPGGKETRRQGDQEKSFAACRLVTLSSCHLALCVRLLLLLIALVALVACGGSGYSQTVQTGSYSVQLSLDGTDFNTRTATVEVRDRSNQPVDGAQVVVVPIMEAMGMVSPEQTAQPLGAGRYQAKGEFFSMVGEWEFDVRVSAGGKEETARFKVPVQE